MNGLFQKKNYFLIKEMDETQQLLYKFRNLTISENEKIKVEYKKLITSILIPKKKFEQIMNMIFLA